MAFTLSSPSRPCLRSCVNARTRKQAVSVTCHGGEKGRGAIGNRAEAQGKVASVVKAASRAVASVAAAAAISLSAPQMASAERIGEFNSSGFIFKDTVQVFSVEDPKVKGVTIWVTDYNRSLAAKLAKDFFSEPSQASITCAVTGPVSVAGSLGGTEGEEIFSEGKNLFQTKTLRIRRIQDVKNSSLIYVAYSTRLTSNPGSDSTSGASRYRTSVCSVVLPQPPAPTPV